MNKTALITGASSGIGLELAKLCARDGYNLLLISRNNVRLIKIAQDLEKQYGIKVLFSALDLAKSDAANHILNLIDERGIEIEILINNAGFGTSGPFMEADIKEQVAMIQLNIVTLTLLTRLIGASMVKRGSGKILNNASVAAYFSGPLMAVYYASKAYVLSLSEALAEELINTGVTVTALCPGPTKTNFQTRAELSKAKLFNSNIMEAVTVAQIGYRAMMQGKRVVIPGIINQIEVFFSRLVPRWLSAKIIKDLHQT